MKAQWGLLCLSIASTIVCEALDVLNEEEDKIEVPENCTYSDAKNGFEHLLTCPDDLFVVMETEHVQNNGQDFVEYRSKVDCSTHLLPYKYLPKMKSNRNSLIFNDCQLPETGSFGDGWSKLEYLEFKNYDYIGPLKREQFSGLDNLRRLKLSIKSSHEMPDDLFSGLTNIKEVSLNVENANKNIFKNLTQLESLRISISSPEGVSNFDTSEMKNLPAFGSFVLSYSNITRLTNRMFEGCGNVEYVLVDANKIGAVDADAFVPLTNVKFIDLLFNTLTSLPAGLFSQNLKLEKIKISLNHDLTSVPAGLFSNLPNLREIQLWSKLTSIPNDLIHGSTNLEILDFRFNNLTTLPRDFLQNHSKLAEIRLTGNRFFSTSSDLFDNKAPITKVNLNY